MNVRQVPISKQMTTWINGWSLALGLFAAQTAAAQVAPTTPPPAQASAASGVVEGYQAPSGDLDKIIRHLQERYAGRARIFAEPRTRRIVAVAPPDVHRDLATWLAQNGAPVERAVVPASAQLATGGPDQRSSQRLVLKHISWKDFEERLFRIWGSRLTAAMNEAGDMARFQIRNPAGQTTLQVDRRNGQVTIDAPGNSAASWLKVLGAIDATEPRAGQASRVVPLDNADPAMVLRAVSLIRSAIAGDFAGSPAANRKNHIGQFVSMVFQPEGAQPAAQPDVQPPPPPGEVQPGQAQPGEAQPIEGEQATAIAGALEGMRLQGNVTIDIVDNVLVVKGPKADVEKVLKIIEEIERQSIETRPEVELYQLKHVDATALNEVLQLIISSAFSYQGTVTIQPLKRPNALLLVGRKENIPAVVELIDKLDRPTPPNSQVKVIPLKNMSAIDAERFVRTFFVDNPGLTAVGTPRTNLGTRVMVIADFRSNSLIVQASPRDLTEVAQLLARLDAEGVGARNAIRVFKLQNSLAEQLAPALQEAITGVGVGGQQQQQQQQQQGGGGAAQQTPARMTQRATSLQLQQLGPDGERLIQSGVLSDMRITADTRGNSLIVVGPPTAMELMAALIEQLDRLPSAEAQIKVFSITNGDATTLVEMLQNLFGQQQQGGGQGQLNLQSATGAGESTLVPLRFSVDQRTNSIIVTGNPGDLEVVRNILVRLDVPDLSQRITTVFRLHNAPAADVATAINNLLDQQRDLNQAAPELITPYQQIEREVLIEPESVTNSLIVSATPRYFDEIKKIVTELDRRPPMVAIQVVIAEVTLTKDEQFGIEWGLQDQLMFDRSIAANRFAFNNATIPNDNTPASLGTRGNVGTQALSNLAVGRIDPTLGFGGLVLTASNESVNVLLRALEQSSRGQVISRPQVQTLDNQLAYVNVGALVPRIQGATQSTFGVTPNVVDTPVGIILEVTPRTSPDGTIVMQVNATKSSVGPDSTAIPIFTDANGNVVRSPQIPLTTAQTTVSARTGQTVILGGLITKDQIETTRRIPYLGDIPMLGRLFRFDSVSDERTELLIILTPYIMQNEEQNEWLNARETERMSWCIADIVNIHGPVQGTLSGNPGYNMPPSDVIFPDIDPTAPTPLPGSNVPSVIPPAGMPVPRAPTPSTPPLPGLGEPMGTAPPSGYGQTTIPPVQTAPVGSGAVPATNAQHGAPGFLQPPAIETATPPPGTQARWIPHGPPQNWGQGYAPPGAVAPATYQQ
jgi:general secretion pathway protein D